MHTTNRTLLHARRAAPPVVLALAVACGGTTPASAPRAPACTVFDEPVVDDGSLHVVVPTIPRPPRTADEPESARDARARLETVLAFSPDTLPNRFEAFSTALQGTVLPGLQDRSAHCVALRDLARAEASRSADAAAVLHALAGACSEHLARVFSGLPLPRDGSFEEPELRDLFRGAIVGAARNTLASAHETYAACVDATASRGDGAAELGRYCAARRASLPRRPDEWDEAVNGRSGAMVREDLERQVAATPSCGVPHVDVTVSFVIDAGGTAAAAHVSRGLDRDPAFAACLVSRLEQVTFRPAPDSPPQRVELRIPRGWVLDAAR